MRPTTAPSRFGVLLYDTVEALDVGATFGVLSMARRLLPNVTMTVIAERTGPVTLANGLQVIADSDFTRCPPLDVMIIGGGAAWVEERHNRAMLEFIRRAAREGAIVASVCTGAMILAETGLLDGRSATTRRRTVGAETAAPLARLARDRPAVSCAEAPVVDQGAIVTGGGVTLAIDTTLHLIGRIYGPDAAADVARAIEYTAALAANQREIGVQMCQ